MNIGSRRLVVGALYPNGNHASIQTSLDVLFRMIADKERLLGLYP